MKLGLELLSSSLHFLGFGLRTSDKTINKVMG